jgi:hypothetical protein
MNLTFDETTHTYKIGEHIVPSVTQVIRTVFPHWEVDQWYLDRGTQVHTACELYDLGTLNWATVDPRILGRVRAWELFRRQYPGKVTAIEVPLGHDGHLYAGKLDRVFAVDEYDVLVDIKNSISPHVFVQLGGYSLMWKRQANPLRKCKGLAVELREDGHYHCQGITERELIQAEKTFVASLTIHNFMKDNGMAKERISHVDFGTQKEPEADHQDQWQGA